MFLDFILIIKAGMKTSPPDGVIRFEVDKTSLLDSYYDGISSPAIDVKGIRWEASLWPGGEEDNLGISLCCNHEQSMKWRIDVNAEFVLINTNSNNNIIEKFSHECGPCSIDYDGSLGDKENIFDETKGFIRDGKLTAEVRLWISNMKGVKILQLIDFLDPNVPYHDIALVIEGEKIYASKQILAAASPVFERMFYSEFAEKNKIELDGVNRAEFIELLHVIYPPNKKINDGSFEYLIKLANRFQVKYTKNLKGLIERIEQFLVDSVESSYNCGRNLEVADRNNFFGLQEHCLSKLESKEDFKTVVASPIFSTLSDTMKLAFFERHYEITMK